MENAFVQEANFARARPLPKGYRQIVYICGKREQAVILKNTPDDWSVEIVVEETGQKFCMAVSPDKTQGWIERWRNDLLPRRIQIPPDIAFSSVEEIAGTLRSALTEGDPGLPAVVVEKLSSCEVEIVEGALGYNILFSNTVTKDWQRMRSLSKPTWPRTSYRDSKGVYVLFRRPDGTALLEAAMVFGRGGGMRRWHAREDAPKSMGDEELIRLLLKSKIHDAELFHRLDAASTDTPRTLAKPSPWPAHPIRRSTNTALS